MKRPHVGDDQLMRESDIPQKFKIPPRFDLSQEAKIGTETVSGKDLFKLFESCQFPIMVCSDVHLGTSECREGEFYAWLKRQSAPTIILLGDLLDCYIYDELDSEADLNELIVEKWKELWEVLHALKEQHVEIHYIPGNHDAFVFFIEAGDILPWAKAVLKRTPRFREIRKETKQFRMREVASIHYPFYQAKTPGGQKVLFTHGHYDSWGWRMLAGMRDDMPMDTMLGWTTSTIVLAHEHARRGRYWAKLWEQEWPYEIQHLQDTAIAITNAVIRAHGSAVEMIKEEPDKAAELIDLALKFYFGSKEPKTAEKRAVRKSIHHLINKVQGPQLEKDLATIRSDTMSYISRARHEQSVSILANQYGTSPILSHSFSDFTDPDVLVFGHYHKPRESDSVRAYDIGGFVGGITTTLGVLVNGSIRR